LITDGPGQHSLLVKHLKPVLHQLIANQMFRLVPYQQFAGVVFIESTLCAKVAALFSSFFEARRAWGLLYGFAVLLALQDLVDAYHVSRSAPTMRRVMDNNKSCHHNGSSVVMAKKFFEELFARE